jgi:hypothetical protein
LITYSTGSEIQFADRAEVDQLLERSRNNGYGIREMIHAVVQSELFRSK